MSSIKHNEHSIGFVAVALVFVSALLRVYNDIDQYMDEIFHVPQVQHYCGDDFTYWDPKITTFPGLYIVTYVFHRILALGNMFTFCNVSNLRVVNLSLSLLLPYLYSSCREKLFPHHADGWMIAALLYLYPISAFYYLLYYTDTLSILSLVLTYAVSIPNAQQSRSLVSVWRHTAIFTCATLSILSRQTNAVWVLFIAGTNMLDTLQRSEVVRTKDNVKVSDTRESWKSASLTVTQLVRFVQALWTHKVVLIKDTISLLLPVVGFAVFVVVNGGIVLGDKENHKPVVHLAMLTHMLFIYALFSLPFFVVETIQWWKRSQGSDSADAKQDIWSVLWAWLSTESSINGVLCWTALGVFAAYSLVHGSLSHPFLLSDNRHYTFYLWSRVLQYPRARMLLAPVYSAFALLAIRRLAHIKGALWLLIFMVAAALTLVPTPLLEPRYFTPGVVIAMLNSPRIDTSGWLGRTTAYLVLLALLAVNIITIYVFAYRTFVWPDGSIARFMY